MDFNSIINALGQFGPAYVILGCVLYWLFVKYIPSKDEEHARQLSSMQELFKSSLDQVVQSYKEGQQGINSRLDKIEEDISKFK